MKSRVMPNTYLFQIVVKDFKHRQPPPTKVVQSKRIWKDSNDIQDFIPIKTLFRWAKNGRRAMAYAKKFGSIISCHKVDSHMRKLEMITHLRTEQKPIEVDISVEDFTIGRDLILEKKKKFTEFDIDK